MSELGNELKFKPQEEPQTENNIEFPKSQTLDHFWESIKSGEFHNLSKEEINNIIENIYFTYEPLTSLAPEEEKNIRKNLLDDIEYSLNRDSFRKLAEDKSLTAEKKISLYSDPDYWRELGMKVMRYGTKRGFEEYFCFRKEGENINSLLSTIRERTGKTQLKVLDIGGGIGVALNELKSQDPNVETFNLTIEEEPAMYKTDHVALCPAERMPKNFEEQMDLVVSYIAFRYFTYPDLALDNALKVLSVGGETRIALSTDRSTTSDKELEDRLGKLYTKFKELEERGYIEMKIFRREGAEEKYPDNFYPSAFIKIVKKKSLKQNG